MNVVIIHLLKYSGLVNVTLSLRTRRKKVMENKEKKKEKKSVKP